MEMIVTQSNDTLSNWKVIDNAKVSKGTGVVRGAEGKRANASMLQHKNYKDSQKDVYQAASGKLSKVMSSQERLQLEEKTSNIGVGLPENNEGAGVSTKKDLAEDNSSDDQITLNESHQNNNRLEGGQSILTKNLNRSKEEELNQLESHPLNESMKVAVFKLPVARNERNSPIRISPPLSSDNYATSSPIVSIPNGNIKQNPQHERTFSVSPQKYNGGRQSPTSPSVLYLYQPPIKQQQNVNQNQFFQLQRFLNKKSTIGAAGFKNNRSPVQTAAANTLSRGAQQESQVTDQTDSLPMTLRDQGSIATISANNKRQFHRVILELPFQNSALDYTPGASSAMQGHKKNSPNSKHPVGISYSIQNDALRRLTITLSTTNKPSSREEGSMQQDNSIILAIVNKPPQITTRRREETDHSGFGIINTPPSASINMGTSAHIGRGTKKAKKQEKIATNLIDYSRYLMSNNTQDPVKNWGNNTKHHSILGSTQNSFRQSIKSPRTIISTQNSFEPNRTKQSQQSDPPPITAKRQNSNLALANNSWFKMKISHFGLTVNQSTIGEIPNHQKSSGRFRAIDERRLLEKQSSSTDMVINPGVKGVPKKMPFYHFSPTVQEKLKIKTSTGNTPTKKRQILVKPPVMMVNRDGKMVPFKTEDSKGVDRSMQMSVSFKGGYQLKGSNLPSQVTVGEIPPPTPSPMKTKGGFEIKQTASNSFAKRGQFATSESVRKGATETVGETSSLLIQRSPSPHRQGIASPGQTDKNISQSSKSFIEAVNRITNNDVQNLFSLTKLNPQKSQAVTTPIEGEREKIKPESADVNIIDQSEGGLKSSSIHTAQQYRRASQKSVEVGIQQQEKEKNFQENLKLIQMIYQNFEKHHLPAKLPRDIKQQIRQMNVHQDEIGSAEVITRAKETLIYDKYSRFQGQGYTRKEEFYLNNHPETGILSGELKKKQDFDTYYKLRQLNNSKRYIDLLSHKIMQEPNTPRGGKTERLLFNPNITQLQSNVNTSIQGDAKMTARIVEDSLYQLDQAAKYRMDGLKSLNIEEEMRRTTNSLVESRDYNRFQHLLNFFQDSLEAPIAIPKKSDILNENRNEALLKIREKIKAKPKRTQELATINKENSLLYPQTVKNTPHNQFFNSRAISQAMSQRASPRNTATSFFQGHSIGSNPYIDYLANKTHFLPALNDQKEVYLMHKKTDFSNNLHCGTGSVLVSLDQKVIPVKKNQNRTQINTLLHMKLQPKLRFTSQDWDFTKDQLDLSLLRDMRKRNKKEERHRLMQSVAAQTQENQKLMLLGTNSLRDSQNSQNLAPQIQAENTSILKLNQSQVTNQQKPKAPPSITVEADQAPSDQRVMLPIPLPNSSDQPTPPLLKKGTIRRSTFEEEEEAYSMLKPKLHSPSRRKKLESKSVSMCIAIEGAAEEAAESSRKYQKL